MNHMEEITIDASDYTKFEAVSNVIELKPDKKYLLVFSGNYTRKELQELTDTLRTFGFSSFAVALREGETLEVIEEPQEEVYTPPFPTLKP